MGATVDDMRLTTSFADGGWRELAVSNPIMGTRLLRLKLPLDAHESDLILVGDRFEEGGHYTAEEIPRAQSEGWSWLDWDEAYDRLEDAWRNAYLLADGTAVPSPAVEGARDGAGQMAGVLRERIEGRYDHG